MTKRILTLALIAGSFSLISCSSEPSDLRPEYKVSVDKVPPGTRSTPGMDNATDNTGHNQQKAGVQLNHDEHANEIGKESNESVSKEEETNSPAVQNHQ